MYVCCVGSFETLSIYVMYFLFFFKQKTAYEMRISDWSSDVCSSDLIEPLAFRVRPLPEECFESWLRRLAARHETTPKALFRHLGIDAEIGRASCRERVCQYV